MGSPRPQTSRNKRACLPTAGAPSVPDCSGSGSAGEEEREVASAMSGVLCPCAAEHRLRVPAPRGSHVTERPLLSPPARHRRRGDGGPKPTLFLFPGPPARPPIEGVTSARSLKSSRLFLHDRAQREAARTPALSRGAWDAPRGVNITDPQTDVARAARARAAMCVRSVDDQGVLQFTLILAAGCVLHRRTSRVIHRQELSFFGNTFACCLFLCRSSDE